MNQALSTFKIRAFHNDIECALHGLRLLDCRVIAVMASPVFFF